MTKSGRVESPDRHLFVSCLAVVRLGHSIYYRDFNQIPIEVELENEPMESAVSSPHDQTHHG